MKPRDKMKVGDVLFGVDPQKLVIVQTSIIEICDGYASVLRDIKLIHQKVRSISKIAMDVFPCESNGFIFFKSEDEAHKYIKLQIGL